ncbi:MAG: hypothetical protein RI958_2206 [Actinomycetota bacterium]|jgi:NAD(P)-dependent dehydrogenase (short-subunit alcohol dehydrogenase family)
MNDTTLSDHHFDLRGRTAIVTGGTRGIGRALVTGLTRAGANVAIVARDADACQRVADEVCAEGGAACPVPAHLGDASSASAIVEATVDAFGGIDIVVNNAATGLAQPIGQLTMAAWEKSMAVNLRGPVFLVEAAVEYLRRSRHASVINVISPGAFVAAADWAMYAAAKAALLSFTRSTAAALGRDHIRVNALCPGPIDTDIFRSNLPQVQDEVARRTALGRVGRPEEMVGPVLFLASSASSFVTGEVLFANGGTID